jgi:hypothetical protein
MVIRLTNGRNIGWTGKSLSWSGTLDHYFANSDIRNNYRLYFTTKDFNSNGAIILSLHFTAATKLATQENSKGYINDAVVLFFWLASPLTVFLLAAICCLSEEMPYLV